MSEPRLTGAIGAAAVGAGLLIASCTWADDPHPDAARIEAARLEEARHLLADMNAAVASSTYHGEFLHLADGRIEKLAIVHRVKDGHVSERLMSLSGNGRQVVRNDSEVQCYLPDERRVVVETHAEHGSLLGTLPGDADKLDANYKLEVVGRVRSVIGRPSKVLAVNPRDRYRFGYRVWIDDATHMPIRTDLCDSQGTVLEQVLFTELRVGGDLPDSMLRPTLPTDGYTWVRQTAGALHAATTDLPWRFVKLPPGFQMRSTGVELMPGNSTPVAHIVFSDGLASVSVFIEGPPSAPRRVGDGEGREGRVGSAFAYSKFVGAHQITAVGEVPPGTVQFIADGVAPAAPAKVSFGAAPVGPARP